MGSIVEGGSLGLLVTMLQDTPFNEAVLTIFCNRIGAMGPPGFGARCTWVDKSYALVEVEYHD